MQKRISELLDLCKKYKAKLVAVTKYQNTESMNTALACGVTDIGENRLQEAKEKFSFLKYPCIKHFIGHLQMNKVKEVVSLFDVIESVDSEKLYYKIMNEAEKQKKNISVFFEFNLTHEVQKYGFSEKDFERCIGSIITSPYVKLMGIMVMSQRNDTEENIRKIFRKAKEISEKYKGIIGKEISMGMSQDFRIALEEGSTVIRVGSYIWNE